MSFGIALPSIEDDADAASLPVAEPLLISSYPNAWRVFVAGLTGNAPAHLVDGPPGHLPEADLAIMRRLDRLHLEFPFAGSRMLRGLLAAEGCKTDRRHVKTLMKRMEIGALSPSADDEARAGAQESIRICCAGWRSPGRTRCGRWT